MNPIWKILYYVGIFYVYNIKVHTKRDADGFIIGQSEVLSKYLTVFGRKVCKLSRTESKVGYMGLQINSFVLSDNSDTKKELDKLFMDDITYGCSVVHIHENGTLERIKPYSDKDPFHKSDD